MSEDEFREEVVKQLRSLNATADGFVSMMFFLLFAVGLILILRGLVECATMIFFGGAK